VHALPSVTNRVPSFVFMTVPGIKLGLTAGDKGTKLILFWFFLSFPVQYSLDFEIPSRTASTDKSKSLYSERCCIVLMGTQKKLYVLKIYF
jgi:hypothetical protein